MTIYRRFMPPPVPMGGRAAASGFSAIIVSHLQQKEQWRLQATLDARENDTGGVARPALLLHPINGPGSDVAESEPLPIGLVAGAQYSRCSDSLLGTMKS